MAARLSDFGHDLPTTPPRPAHSGEYSTLKVADLRRRPTVYRAIERQRIAAAADLETSSAPR